MTLTVDVFSDVICPWCYVGKRRLEAAVRQLPDLAVRVRWRAFQLNPAMPTEGMDRRAYRTRKFGTWERSLELDRQLTDTAALDGLAFAFDKIARTPNTFDAHRVLWLAEREGVQDAVAEALFKAYFVDGRNFGDRAELLAIAATAGLDRDRVTRLLDSDEGAAEVRADDAEARELGAESVPFFVIRGETPVGIAGAVPTEMLVAALTHAAHPNAGPTCDVARGTC
ncbi:MAG: DsbA family oxidoreductase [Fimbriiglobus sp.]|jgi:predicted DsbA family dithiol-disulfide isomerase|nr:DsbA family oxidoreductase [Fimbriiglobus sp.]